MENKEKVKTKMKALRPEIPWAHYFDFGCGIESVSSENEKFYKKAMGLRKLGELVIQLGAIHTDKQTLHNLTVLDIASGEGGHSIEMAKKGARVTGIEGRKLYVERAQFAARIMGIENVTFRHGDVREMNPHDLGKFDLVLCLGILHHLDAASFLDFIKSVYELTGGTLIIYTHVSTPQSIKRFNLDGPINNGKYKGWLFREHEENSPASTRADKVRASLNNSQSFWATPEALFSVLSDVGYSFVYSLWKPHIFSRHADIDFRPIIIARKRNNC